MKIYNYYEENSGYLAANPDWHLADSHYKFKIILKLLKEEKLNLSSIIDVGCGYGVILKKLNEKLPSNVSFKGYDVSPDAIKFAKKFECSNLQFINGNLIDSDDNCDLLLMIDVFEHVQNYIEFIKLNVAKSQYIIFHIPIDISIESIIRKSYLWTRENFGHLHYFTSDLVFEILNDMNLDVLRYHYTSELDLPRKSLGAKILYPIRKLFEILFKRRISSLFFGGYSIMVLVRNKNCTF